jgi:hypothetical protein
MEEIKDHKHNREGIQRSKTKVLKNWSIEEEPL